MSSYTISVDGTHQLVQPLIAFYEANLMLDNPPLLQEAPCSLMQWMRSTIKSRVCIDVITKDPQGLLEDHTVPGDSTVHFNYLALYKVRFVFDSASDAMVFKLMWL